MGKRKCERIVGEKKVDSHITHTVNQASLSSRCGDVVSYTFFNGGITLHCVVYRFCIYNSATINCELGDCFDDKGRNSCTFPRVTFYSIHFLSLISVSFIHSHTRFIFIQVCSFYIIIYLFIFYIFCQFQTLYFSFTFNFTFYLDYRVKL